MSDAINKKLLAIDEALAYADEVSPAVMSVEMFDSLQAQLDNLKLSAETAELKLAAEIEEDDNMDPIQSSESECVSKNGDKFDELMLDLLKNSQKVNSNAIDAVNEFTRSCMGRPSYMSKSNTQSNEARQVSSKLFAAFTGKGQPVRRADPGPCWVEGLKNTRLSTCPRSDSMPWSRGSGKKKNQTSQNISTIPLINYCSRQQQRKHSAQLRSVS